MAYLITKKSSNRKVGPIMVTTSTRETCPNACPFKGNGCYADGGPLRGLWDKLTATPVGETFKSGRAQISVKSHDDLLKAIMAQPEGAVWRHNQAGDLPGVGDAIDEKAFNEIVTANQGRRGFTYTHKPMTEINRRLVRDANAHGFTVNVSSNNLEHADEMADLEAGPVVTIVSGDQLENTVTPKGRKVVICPVVTGKAKDCATCKLCAVSDRKSIVAFPVHGAATRKATKAMEEFIS